MANSQKLLDLLVKVDRAQKHLSDLAGEYLRFSNRPKPFETFHEDDVEKGERTYYLRINKEIPIQFSALVGDFTQNLRSALDHLAWHLVQNSPVTPKARERDIYFPIFETESAYRDGKARKTKGMTEEAKRAIDEIKPYYRADGIGIGQPALYWLSEINNLDKHRLLVPIWASAPGHTITKSRRAEVGDALREVFGTDDVDVTIPSLIDSSVPLVNGSLLCTLPIADVDDRMRFQFRVVLAEPAGIRGKELISTLGNMHRVVRNIMFDFDRKGLL